MPVASLASHSSHHAAAIKAKPVLKCNSNGTSLLADASRP